ncbi:MAG: hypothetical protein AAB780_01625 [Patescibacteria group bacterium]
MFTFSLFVISGVAIATLTVSKRIEEKKKQTPIVLRAVSKGDERVRALHHHALHQYSHGKDKFAFWFKKQLPLKLKSFWNRFQAYARERSTEYLGDVRGSRLLKKSDGISEFFKSVSEIEKGVGEINESLPQGFHIEEVSEKPIEVTESRVETITTNITEEKPVYIIAEPEVAPAPKKKRTYKPRMRKLAVVEVLD